MSRPSSEQLKDTIAANVKAAREESGMTQRELGVAIDVDSMQVSRWERGVVTPNQQNLVWLASVLDRDVSWFYADHDDEPAKAAA